MKVISCATGAIVAGSAPFVRRDKVTEDLVKDATALANTLTRMSNITSELAARAAQNDSVVFQDKVVGAAGEPFVMSHGLNRRVNWKVVDWSDIPGNPPTAVTVAPILVRDTTLSTNNTLVLRSYAAGNVSIEVG